MKEHKDDKPVKQFNGDPRGVTCPVCGQMCLGAGGQGCIDKPSLLKNRKFKKFTKPER